MQTMLKPQNPLTQLLDLTVVQLSNWRWSWRSMIIVGTITPLLSTLALGLFSRREGIETLSYILTGNLVLAIMFNNLSRVSSNFSFMRTRGMLSYFASLPIRAVNLVLATVLAFFLLSLPSLLVTLLAGVAILKLDLTFHPLVLVVVPLATICMSGLGALIGTSVRTPEEADSISLLSTFIMLGLGPVLIPPDRLPSFMVILGYISPATYAASAFRQVLLGPVTARILVDLAILAIFCLSTLWLVERKMTWRQSQV